MRGKMKGIAAAVAAVAVLGVGGAAIAGASGVTSNEGPDKPITGTALDQASAAALKATGGGKVTGTEVGDEESYFEVEVTNPDGSQTDVQLDKQFNVVGQKTDGGESQADTGR